MVVSVPPENLERITAVFDSENVEATVIGTYGNDGQLLLRYEGQTVGQLDMKFLHHGLPKYTRKALWHKRGSTEPQIEAKDNYNDQLKAILADYNVASKEWVVRQYDHEVQGGSVIKPLVGVENDGPGDAAVVRPRLEKDMGVAVGCGICPGYSDIDPYWMALAAIDEAVRNVVAVGGRADRIALLDNFCWGNCNKPDRLAGLVRAAKGCYDGAMAYQAPFISGKDSLNNEFVTDQGETINIPGTLLISAMTLVDDVNRCVTMDAKQAGNVILIVGETKNELGAGNYYKLHKQIGANVPKVDLHAGPQIVRAIAAAIENGLIKACHDCSEGGLAVALAEMAFAGGLGMDINLTAVPCGKDVDRNDQILFSESTSRFIVEIAPEDFSKFAKVCQNVRFGEIGVVTSSSGLQIKDSSGNLVIDADIAELKQVWQEPLRW